MKVSVLHQIIFVLILGLCYLVQVHFVDHIIRLYFDFFGLLAK